MNTKFDCDIVNGLANALGGRIDLLEKMLGLKVREGLKYADIQKIVKSGFAKEFFDLGDEIMTTYTATDGTVYDFPWRIVDFRDVYWENDPDPHPGMVLMSKYTTLEAITYGCSTGHIVDVSETVAQEGWYYFGKVDQYRIYLLNLNVGDTIPREGYITIYKSGINDTLVLNNGYSDYVWTCIRQWLNSDGEAGNWWTPMFLGDNEPPEHSTYNGFMHGFESDFLNVVTPTRLVTWHFDNTNKYLIDSYDKFYVPSAIELYGFSDSDASMNPGNDKYFEYFKKALEKEGYDYPYDKAVNSRIMYKLDDHTTSANYVATRTNQKMISHIRSMWPMNGRIANLNPSGDPKNQAPCCVIS